MKHFGFQRTSQCEKLNNQNYRLIILQNGTVIYGKFRRTTLQIPAFSAKIYQYRWKYGLMSYKSVIELNIGKLIGQDFVEYIN